MRIGLVGVGRIGAFHAETLRDIDAVSGVVVADADRARARDVAEKLGVDAADDVDGAFRGVDGVVVAASTEAHPRLVAAAAEAGVPVCVEKPVAGDVTRTREVLARVAEAGVPLQVGFQRRFDPGYVAAREAVRAGRLGRLHTVRSMTADPVPPPAAYIATSGGIFRDCGVHDFDSVRWVTGREVVEAVAVGANAGEPFFAEAGDVDTAAVLLTLDDGTLAVVSLTRYNGAGYDVRLEACGSTSTLVAGLEGRAPMASADPGTSWPPGPAYRDFMERFRSAYVAELQAFTRVVAGESASPCTGEDALEATLVAEAADLSWRERRPVRVEEVRA